MPPMQPYDFPELFRDFAFMPEFDEKVRRALRNVMIKRLRSMNGLPVRDASI